ncbi:MAG: GntR family transcriptional regulator [Pseudonocardiaceae bacterium]
MVVDLASGHPAYQQIADELRKRVVSGVLAPGSKLPTEVELMGEFTVSRVVARLAVGVLRAEGLIYSRQGAPTVMASTRDGRPRHQQIAAELRAQIMSGELAPGAQLPSTQHLVRQYAAANATI